MLFTREFIIGFAQKMDMPAEDLQRVFARNTGIFQIITSAGGIDNLESEIGALQAEYARACVG